VIGAEWVKFRTVRGWVLAAVVAAVAIVGLGIAGISGNQGSGGGQAASSCYENSCAQPLGPGGEPVSDSFYFVHQALTGNGSITARVTSLTSAASPQGPGPQRVVVPWAKGGVILKASLRQGSAYAAIMVTGSHGVRMQDNFTGDIAGPAMSDGWLRLTRSGPVITGYASPDGVRWTRVGVVTLSGLPATVQGGLFATSPQYSQTSLGVASIDGSPSQDMVTFDHVALAWPGDTGTGTETGAWTGTNVGGTSGPASGPPTGYARAGGQFTLTGSGDIAPATSGPAGFGVTLAQTLTGTFVALIVLAVVGAMFVTTEYRRGMIRVTLAACPRRGRVLAAKAAVIGLVAFAAGLAGAAVIVPLGLRMLTSQGVYIPPVTALTEVRVIIGTAAAIAVCAVLAVAIGTAARRGAAAIAAIFALIIVPYMLAVTTPVVPLSVSDWLMRVTPAAAFAVQQTVTQYPQVDDIYAPAYGYFPLDPWAGFLVLCAWAALALAVAYLMLNRRDA
jgi:ABC-type transport system involved in multi-copper enzyme maturation permease subunit